MSMGGHQSRKAKSETWLTPPEIIERLGPFDLDPCTPVNMPWKTAAHRYTPVDDGLVQEWFGRVWCNPPYGDQLGYWLERMAAHGVGTALIFARTETRDFHRYVWARASALFFFHGRLSFHRPDGRRGKNAGAPSVLVAYGTEDCDRLAECGFDGRFIPLSDGRQTILVIRHEEGKKLTWTELMVAIVDRQGGHTTLTVAYQLVARHPKAQRNPNWKAKVRQVLQGTEFQRTGRAKYRRAEP